MTLNFVIPEVIIGGEGTPTLQFYKKGFNLVGRSPSPSWQDIILSGNTALTLVNAKEDGLNYLKLFGGTEQLPETYLDTVTLDGACAQRNLPEGYTEVEYIESDGTQYIDTGIVLKSKATVTTVGQFLSLPQGSVPSSIWGFMGSSSNLPRWGCASLWVSTNIRWLMDLNNTFASLTADTNKHTFVNETNGSTTYDSFVDGNSIYTSVQTIESKVRYTENTLSAYIFARNNNGTAGNFSSTRIYNFNIVQDDVEVINLIPARRNSDSVLGMYDTVSDTFLTNAGTGTFTAGSNAVPTPDNPIDIVCNNGAIKVDSQGNIYTDGTQEVVTDNVGNTASADMLLAVSTYKDTQEVLSGAITRNVGIKVLDGTEDWIVSSSYLSNMYNLEMSDLYAESAGAGGRKSPYCTHFQRSTNWLTTTDRTGYIQAFTSSTNKAVVGLGFGVTGGANLPIFKAWLAEQYANGTPVIIVYPKSSATTSSVSGQVLTKSPVTQTAGAISGLTITTTESAHTTPTPTQPLPINCNNGVLKPTANLFDKNAALADHWLWLDYDSKAERPTQQYYGTNQIPVKGNTKYTRFGTHGSGNFYLLNDGTKTIVTDSSATITTPANAVGWTFNVVMGTSRDQMMVVEGDTLPSDYVPYGVYADGTQEKVEVFGKNLFDKSEALEDNKIWTSALGGKTTMANYYGVSPIPVKGGHTYTRSGEHGGVNYFLLTDGTSYTLSDSSATITAPNDAVMWIFNNKTSTSRDTMMVVEGSTLPTTYEPYYNGGTATAEMLLKVSTYQDEQNVTTGSVTRKVGVKMLDGTENWQNLSGYMSIIKSAIGTNSIVLPANSTNMYCTHFTVKTDTFVDGFGSGSNYINFKYDSLFTTLTEWTNYLKSEFNAGHPVIIVFPLATATTESVTAQDLTLQEGTNIVEITQASMDNLELEVSYKAGVTVTITEVQNAQLDNSVEVTIS